MKAVALEKLFKSGVLDVLTDKEDVNEALFKCIGLLLASFMYRKSKMVETTFSAEEQLLKKTLQKRVLNFSYGGGLCVYFFV